LIFSKRHVIRDKFQGERKKVIFIVRKEFDIFRIGGQASGYNVILGIIDCSSLRSQNIQENGVREIASFRLTIPC
jgi:hypothetical protein